MNFNFNVDKEKLKVVGKTTVRIGKAIVIEGSKGLLKNALLTALDKSYKGGMSSIKDIRLDDVIGEEKPKLPKEPRKKWFSKESKAVEALIEETKELAEDAAEEVVDKQ